MDTKMKIRAKAPLRLGLAGGGTDVSPYCDEYGGCVLNISINMYAYCTIEPTNNNTIEFYAVDRNEHFSCTSCSNINIDNLLPLHKGVYNKIINRFLNNKKLSFKMFTYSDAPAGSGLGTSSTLVVAIIKAFTEWLNLPLGEYEIASLAYEIERKDIKMSGGKQDQYSATFGGLNFIEFYSNDQVIVNPLRIKNWIRNELESMLILYNTGTSRSSSQIINEQIINTKNKNEISLKGLDMLKKSAIDMKRAILQGDFDSIVNNINISWNAKKKISNSITNKNIDEIYDIILNHGGLAAKISGAGGGGFMMILCDPTKRYNLIKKLDKYNGYTITTSFIDYGAKSWVLH